MRILLCTIITILVIILIGCTIHTNTQNNENTTENNQTAVNTTLLATENIAMNWILSSPTYNYDGTELKLLNHQILNSNPLQDILTYEFTSSSGGYGDRTGQMTTQAITPHVIIINIMNREIKSAVIDNKWDEIHQISLTISLITIQLEYNPKQCQKTPWDDWLTNSSIKFVMAPSEKEIIKMYYSQKYDINIIDAQRINLTEISCTTCNVCAVGYKYVATISQDDTQKMLDTGWEQNENIQNTTTNDTNTLGTQIANPASTYCIQKGYNNVIKTNTDGSQTGYCEFGNGKECEEWAYYRGECNNTT